MGRSEISFSRILAQSLSWQLVTTPLKRLLCLYEAELWKMAPAQSESGLLGQLVKISSAISQLQMRDRVKALAPALTPETGCIRGGHKNKTWVPVTVIQQLNLQENPCGRATAQACCSERCCVH